MKILIAEDESIFRSILEEMLKKWNYEVVQVSNGREAWQVMQDLNPPPLAILDWMMPEMDGLELCQKIRASAVLNSTYIIFLTAKRQNVDLIVALESGANDYIRKPFDPEELRARIRAAERIIQLQLSEKEILEKTLRGSIKVLSELLSLINPEAFGRSSRITRYVREIAAQMKEVDTWEVEAAAMLSQIGFAILPRTTVEKIVRGVKLTEKEEELLKTHSSIASDLIAQIPRLEKVSEIIAFQGKNYDGTGFPPANRKEEEIPLGARLLKVAIDFDALEIGGCAKEEALSRLKARVGFYDPKALGALEKVIGIETKYEVRSLSVSELTEEMVLAEDIRTAKGVLLVSKGQEISFPILQRLKQLVSNQVTIGPIRVVASV